MSTFGGDEVSAIVLDVGSCWTRAGYAGEDSPKTVFPTYYGYIPENRVINKSKLGASDLGGGEGSQQVEKKTEKYVMGDSEISVWREYMEIRNPLKDGLIQDWDALEHIWDYALSKRLSVNPVEHPLLVTEAAWSTREIRETLTELAFEKYNCLAFYTVKNPVLTAFASGRPTAIVLDSGAATTSVVPVFDGYVLKKGMQRSPIAGDFLSDQILRQFEQQKITLNPQYLVANKSFTEPDTPAVFTKRDRSNTTDSFHRFQAMKVIHEYKETVCQVFESTYNEAIIASRPMKSFEFPDGFNTSFGPERYKVPEILFRPPEFTIQPQETGVDVGSYVGIPGMIYNCLATCDVDMRANFLANLVCTGGSTLFPNFIDRVYQELNPSFPGHRVKIHAPVNSVERKCSAWLGGSILASLGTFHQLWISRKEYDDHGKVIVEKKCE
ncbi:2170_t:CDS:2 [Ambispora gerdemannii]|uniref:2170_t:CDS:1 n=1 Tax=Ambispora gerdemannii TaxID=144530 RepID=A0A9N8WNN8_9GLOM|nr:2170_t:CDS:2 [Ambispora gerdemannii]